jgi:hypothetical protein
MRKVTYEIVESPVAGDPLFLLREQEARRAEAPQRDWRELLHYHVMKNINAGEPSRKREFREESNFQGFAPDAFDPRPGDLTRLAQELGAVHDDNEDRMSGLSDNFLGDLEREIKSIFGDAATNITFRHFTFDEDGNMVEI